MNTPVKVLNILSDLARGGTTQVIMNYYRNMNENEVVYDFLCLTESKGVYEEEIEEKGGEVYKIKPISSGLFFNIKSTMSFFKNHSYDVVEIHSPTPLRFSYALIAKLYGTKTIIFHAHNSNLTPSIKEKVCSKIVNRICDFNFACSILAGEYMYGGKSFQIINNAIQLEKFDFNLKLRTEIRKQFSIKENENVIGFLGRLDNKQKNLDLLVDVFYRVLEEKKDCVLFIVGDGDYRKIMESKINQLRIQDKVVFTGMVNSPERYYNAFDCFAIPSFYEGFPVTLVEAQTNGLPIIASDCISSDTNIIKELYEAITINRDANAVELWKDAIISSFKKNRYGRVEDMKEAGFDIKHESMKLQNFYSTRKDK